MELKELMNDCARRQKKGLHFIMTSIVIWGLICAAHLTDLTIEQKKQGESTLKSWPFV